MPNLLYATSGPGPLYGAIGWFNFADLPASFSSPRTQTLTNNIPGGGSITATFECLGPGGGGSGSTFVTDNVPTWSGAAFGNTAYIGIPGLCGLRDDSVRPPNLGQIRVTNIQITDRYGNPVTNYNLYFTDAETPEAGVSQQFITNGGPWQIFYTLPPTSWGTCGLSGVGTQTVNTVGLGNSPLLVTSSPTAITQTLTGGATMVFGFSFTGMQVVKNVTNRLSSNDQFQIDITGAATATTITSTQTTGAQPEILLVTTGTPGSFTIDESMASGSDNVLGLYHPTVQVSNVVAGGSVLPGSISLGGSLTLTDGDFALVTIVNAPAPTNVTVNKTVDKTYAESEDVLTYTIAINNNSEYPIYNAVFVDTVPSNALFIDNSLTLNTSPLPGTPDLITLGTLPVGSLSTITFQVSIPNPPPSPNGVVNVANLTFQPAIGTGSVNSQVIVSTINSAILSAVKSTDTLITSPGNTITYTVTFANTGSTSANNVLFLDTIPTGLELVAGSFTQDSSNISSSPNAPGVVLPNSIGPNSVSTITYRLRVNSLPTPNPVLNTAYIDYSYTVDPISPDAVSKNMNTNTTNTFVNGADLSGIVKGADKIYTLCGDTVTYTISIPNTGNITAYNITFRDTIPSNTILIDNSVVVNSVTIPGADPQAGLFIGTLPAGNTAIVSFKVLIDC